MGGCGSKAKEDDPAAGNQNGEQEAEDDQDYNPLTEDEVNARIVCSNKAELFKLGKKSGSQAGNGHWASPLLYHRS